MKWWTIVVFFIGSTWAGNSIDGTKCRDIQTQRDLDLDGIIGKWYVIEILHHRASPTLPSPTRIPPIVQDTCPIVGIRRGRREERSGEILRLLWTEGMGTIEYTFEVTDLKNDPGYWRSSGRQNGTLTEDPNKNYSQFKGTVHVMKAVMQEMLLTFCSGYQGNQFYSILLGRQHKLERGTKSIHELLEHRKIMISSVQSTCAKGTGASIQGSNTVVILMATIALAILRFLSPTFSSNNW
ncbi:uncharacterized protein [Fopius arisanus]|uniref:Uncharacterized protein n=1 Tax=Fopius arisanus TaxID=64838 RepID=A0A0C9RAB9_9HYME|nr:PREDICTED: uncharacterized protein LOC105267064 [Fopius arisanus]XP_011303972.1 PREDICTED: uncharacterized protein LOC105267064 [Fopius arisanus]XP_011303973.1 PREDICTED: uncharacterized protein LOC105267064 [Fopius arisanus]